MFEPFVSSPQSDSLSPDVVSGAKYFRSSRFLFAAVTMVIRKVKDEYAHWQSFLLLAFRVNVS